MTFAIPALNTLRPHINNHVPSSSPPLNPASLFGPKPPQAIKSLATPPRIPPPCDIITRHRFCLAFSSRSRTKVYCCNIPDCSRRKSLLLFFPFFFSPRRTAYFLFARGSIPYTSIFSTHATPPVCLPFASCVSPALELPCCTPLRNNTCLLSLAPTSSLLSRQIPPTFVSKEAISLHLTRLQVPLCIVSELYCRYM